MVNTVFPDDGGGNDGTAFQTTPEEGVLVLNGSAVITYGGDVTPGSTNTLTFIIADANDNELDTTAFIQGLGNAPPPGGTPVLAADWNARACDLGDDASRLRRDGRCRISSRRPCSNRGVSRLTVARTP